MIGVRMAERRETHALEFEQGRAGTLETADTGARDGLLSMTTSLNVAEMLGLRWKRLNLERTGAGSFG